MNPETERRGFYEIQDESRVQGNRVVLPFRLVREPSHSFVSTLTQAGNRKERSPEATLLPGGED